LEETIVDRNEVYKIVFTTFLDREVSERLKELGAHADGGRASGDRKRKLAEATVEAYQDATFALEQLEAWSDKNV
jgi:predicted DNA-binding protein